MRRLAVIWALLMPCPGWSAPEAAAPPAGNGYEWALLPVLSGNTDIGFLFGVFGGLVKLDRDHPPYRWKGRAVATMSVKDGPDGVQLPQHMYEVYADITRMTAWGMRLQVRAYFERTINAGFFGLGNVRHGAAMTEADEHNGRRFQYIHTEPFLHVMTELPLDDEFDLLVGCNLRYVMPRTYAGSLLRAQAAQSSDANSEIRRLYGTDDHAILQLELGLQWDTRNDRRMPTSGMLHNVSFRLATSALGAKPLEYGGVTLTARGYLSLWGDRLVLAGRALADLLFGAVPFHDLASADAFQPMGMPGGPAGIRGVPDGRYRGKIKLALSCELRSTFLRFHWLGRLMVLGGAVFFDTGRVWTDYRYDAQLDGKGLGFTYGIGAGPRIGIGEALYFRLDFSYAPEAVDANPDLPIGIYFALGEMF